MLTKLLFPLFLFCFSILGAVDKGPIVLIVGTRPEAIKTIPVYRALQAAGLPVVLCSTGQHKELLDDILTLFQVTPDFDLQIMKSGQDLFHITEQVLDKTREVFEKVNPSLVIVQGDTTSAMASALSAYYKQIPVAHIEAGLRTGNIYAPFPEEMNRLIISRIACLHFAPTELAAGRLKSEGIAEETIFITGNPVVDALYAIKEKMEKLELKPSPELVEILAKARGQNKKIALLTTHRRENFGQGLHRIFSSVKHATALHPDLLFIYPMHPNPKVKRAFQEVFVQPHPQILVSSPLAYHDLVYLLHSADVVFTDSGGIQEEAISLNKPTLVLRNETDRPEGLESGLGYLVGDNEEKILSGLQHILNAKTGNPSPATSPYGDGHASEKIQTIVRKFYG